MPEEEKILAEAELAQGISNALLSSLETSKHETKINQIEQLNDLRIKEDFAALHDMEENKNFLNSIQDRSDNPLLIRKRNMIKNDRREDGISRLIENIYYCNNRVGLQCLKSKIASNWDKCTPCNEFISIFPKIKSYIDQIKQNLYKKLWDLQLVQVLNSGNCHLLFKSSNRIRRSQSNDLYYHNRDLHTLVFCKEKSFFNQFQAKGNKKQAFILKAFNEAPNNFRKFLRSVIDSFVDLGNENIVYIETLCKNLLKLCNTNQDTQQYNLHYSIFYERILKDKLIRVCF